MTFLRVKISLPDVNVLLALAAEGHMVRAYELDRGRRIVMD
jgi:hypothetical protein